MRSSTISSEYTTPHIVYSKISQRHTLNLFSTLPLFKDNQPHLSKFQMYTDNIQSHLTGLHQMLVIAATSHLQTLRFFDPDIGRYL